MTDAPRLTVYGVVLDAPDPRELAAFYRRLLGWDVRHDEEEWARIVPPGAGPESFGLSFQTEPEYTPPVWPARRGEQAMMMHLDIGVADMAAAQAHALACGARLAEHQPQPDVRVFLDPAGHPFCLFPDE